MALVALALAAGVLIGRASKDDSDQADAGTASSTLSTSQQASPSGDAGDYAQKGDDAGAKVVVITAAEAMETCATDNNGQYSPCNADKLLTIEPTLTKDKDKLKVSSTATSYTIEVESPTGNRFTLERLSNGTTERTCSESGVAGCAAGSTW